MIVDNACRVAYDIYLDVISLVKGQEGYIRILVFIHCRLIEISLGRSIDRQEKTICYEMQFHHFIISSFHHFVRFILLSIAFYYFKEIDMHCDDLQKILDANSTSIEQACGYSILYFQRYCLYARVRSRILQHQVDSLLSMLLPDDMESLYGETIANALRSGNMELIQPLQCTSGEGENDLLQRLLVILYNVMLFERRGLLICRHIRLGSNMSMLSELPKFYFCHSHLIEMQSGSR